MRETYLPEEEPQIPCPVCEVIDCMIHNPRYRYYMNCGQRLLGPHTCPNERECPEPLLVQYPIPIGVTRSAELEQRVESSERRAHFAEDPLLLPKDTDIESLREMGLSSARMLNMDLVTRPIPPPTVPSRPSFAELPTYDEAITSDQGIATHTRIAPGAQNVLHHIDYSSDPEEARIHFELMSPTRRVRSQDRLERSPRRQRRDSPENSGVSHYHYYQGDINVGQPPWMAGTLRAPRGYARIRQAPGGGDESSPGDEGDTLPGEGDPGRGQPPVRRSSEAPWRGAGGSLDGNPGDNGSPSGRR